MEEWYDDIEAARHTELILVDADSDKVRAFEQQMAERTGQISNVTKSIGKIQEMFISLNEIVSAQG